MIKISSSKWEQDKFFKDYHGVCNYINGMERNKSIKTGEMNWTFVKHQYKTISSLYYTSPLFRNRLTDKEREAVEKQSCFIEIKKGSEKNVIQFLYRPSFDIEPLKKNWCQDYCDKHDIEITEISSESII